jgi:citrate/tricarballylate utilization protein
VGGIGLVAGPIGLWAMRERRDPAAVEADQKGLDRGFILLLVLTSATGLALLAFRESAAMGVLLIVHLAFVLTLFVTLPYGKFVHGLYRVAALIQYARETQSPAPEAEPPARPVPEVHQVVQLFERVAGNDE